MNALIDCDEAELTTFAYEKLTWVFRKQAEKDLSLSHRPTKDFVSREGFSYPGRSYRLLHTDARDRDVKLELGRLVKPRKVAICGGGLRAMVAWYRACARRWLPSRIEPWTQRLGLKPGGLDVRDLGYQWGLFGKNDRVYFHWATNQLPPTLVDYVIVHELAPVHEPNQTPDFWLRVVKALPNFEVAKAELVALGSRLWLGDNRQGARD